MSVEGRLRWAIFTNSVVSAVENPEAHLWRVLGHLLRQSGHEAMFFEPRGNDAVRALLQRSGSRALSEFRNRHPDIEYRTLEPRSGADLVEWMTRTLATADVALIQSNGSGDLIGWLGRLTRPHLQTFFVDTGWNGSPIDRAGLAELLVDFSAIAVGDDRLGSDYRQSTADVPIISFAPLPERHVVVDLGDARSDALDGACQRLINAVVSTHVETSTKRSAPISSNGHRTE